MFVPGLKTIYKSFSLPYKFIRLINNYSTIMEEKQLIVAIQKVAHSQEEDLESCSKEELIAKITHLNATVSQLKNIINKQNEVPKSRKSNKPKRQFDFSKCHKRHVLFQVLYLGWNFDGLVVQDNTTQTIEHYLFYALRNSCLIESRETSNYHRCGRTDKGVSALCQIISIDVRSVCAAGNDREKLPYCNMLNRNLPPGIRVVAWAPVDNQMSARFNCTARTYMYVFPRGCLNVELMQRAASYLIGTHDFRNFCKMDVRNGVLNYTRQITEVNLHCIGKSTTKSGVLQDSLYDMCQLKITGSAFLWHQIRNIVSVLFLVGYEKESPEIINSLLDINLCPNKPQYMMAAGVPLCLYKCDYDAQVQWQFSLDEYCDVIKKLQSYWTDYAVKAQVVRNMLEVLESKIPDAVVAQTDSLMKGAKPRVYKPLLLRPSCRPLEDRIDHYVKKRKLQVVTDADGDDSSEPQSMET